MNLTKKISLVLIGSALLPLLVLSCIAIFSLWSTTKSSIETDLIVSVQKLMDDKEKEFSDAANNIKAWAELPVMQDILSDDSSGNLLEQIKKLQKQYIFFSDFKVLNDKGKILSKVGDLTIDNDYMKKILRVTSKGNIFQGFLNNDNEKYKYSYVFAHPVIASYNDSTVIGTLIGVVSYNYFLNDLSEISISSNKQNNDQILILQNNLSGDIIYNTKGINIDQKQLIFDNENLKELVLNDNKYIVSRAKSTKYINFEDPNWVAYIAISTNKAYEVIYSLMLKFILASSVLLGIVILVGLRMAKSISMPIISIADVVNKLSVDNTSLDFNKGIFSTEQRKFTEEFNVLADSLIKLCGAVKENLLMQEMTSDYPVIKCDKNFTINYINGAAKKILQEIGISADNIINSELKAVHLELWNNRDKYRNKVNMPLSERLKFSNQNWIDLKVNRLEDSNKVFDGIYINLKDVTDQVTNEESIKKAQVSIQNLINLAADGILDHRINPDEFRGFYKKLAEIMNNLFDTILRPIDKLILTLQSIAEGDLTHNMDGDFKGSFNKIQTAANSTIANLKQIISKLFTASTNITNSAEEISLVSKDLSTRNESQNASLEQISTIITQLTSSLRKNNELTNEANKLSRESINIAEKGGKSVVETIDSIKSIETSSNKIVDIITVIDEIAFQTNLLALNAAVEAARAGDAGKGFAVVSSEVRTLAVRSSNASKQIKSLILDSVSKIKKSVEVSNKSGEGLKEIISIISKLAQLVSDISSQSKEQANAIESVNNSVSSLETVTQQNTEVVIQNTSSGEMLKNEAAKLQEVIRQFTVD